MNISVSDLGLSLCLAAKKKCIKVIKVIHLAMHPSLFAFLRLSPPD